MRPRLGKSETICFASRPLEPGKGIVGIFARLLNSWREPQGYLGKRLVEAAKLACARQLPRDHQEALSAGIWLPDGVWVASGVSEVLAAFVTIPAAIIRERRELGITTR